MSELAFSVRSGSSDEVYSLRAYRTASGVRFSCSCPAGDQGTACKHRAALLAGDVTSVVDVDPASIEALRDMVGTSPIAAALVDVADAEKAVAAAQRVLKQAKKDLGRAMMG